MGVIRDSIHDFDMPLVGENNEPFNPLQIGFLGATAVMADAHGFAQRIKQPWASGAGLRTCLDASVIHLPSSHPRLIA